MSSLDIHIMKSMKEDKNISKVNNFFGEDS